MLCACALATAAAWAQSGKIQPPQAQAWIDVATFSGLGMPAAGAGSMSAMGAMGSLLGGGSAKNTFGQTQAGTAGRWVDVTLHTRANPQLAEAQQAVPAGFLSQAAVDVVTGPLVVCTVRNRADPQVLFLVVTSSCVDQGEHLIAPECCHQTRSR